MERVLIVDYGAGNLRSVARCVAHLGYEPVISVEARALDDARAVIVPGVGAAADTMRHRRLHPAYAWGFALVIVSEVARFLGAGTPQWLAFAKWVTT